MKNDSPRYEYFEAGRFSERISKIKRRDRDGFQRIKSAINKLLINPSNHDGPLHGNNKGKFKKYVGRNLFRLIYSWCEICVELDYQRLNNCDICNDIPPNSVIFFDIIYKHEYKKFDY